MEKLAFGNARAPAELVVNETIHRDRRNNTMPDQTKLSRKLFKINRIAGGSLALLVFSYLLLLYFPQPLFAYSRAHGQFNVHSREPLDGIETVLDSAETRLRRSPLYDGETERPIYLTNGFGMYALLSHKAFRSFANSVSFIDNVFINKTDIGTDLVFVNREKNNSRSLSGVIAHEVTHLFIRKRYGSARVILMPAWKNEGYCEYIAGDTTIPFDEGIRLWRENPSDDTGYRYIKYQAMVKYLLETERLTVDQLFTQELDEKEVAARTLASLQ